MERKLLSLPSFFVLLLVAGIAFLATPVVELHAAVPTVTVARTTPASGTAGADDDNLVFTITFSEAVKVTGETPSGGSEVPAAMGFGIEDVEVKFAPAATPAGRTGTLLRDPVASELTKADTTKVPGVGTIFTVTLAVPSNENGTATVSIRDAGAGADESAFVANDGSDSAFADGGTTSAAIPYATHDGTKPTVEITAGAGATGDGSGATQTISATGGLKISDIFQLEFKFSEPLGTSEGAGFVKDDVSIATTPEPAASAPTTATSTVVRVGPKPGADEDEPTFIVVIDPGDGATKVTVGVKKDAVADANGNKLDPAATKDITINARPTVMISPTNTVVQPVPLEGANSIDSFGITLQLSAVPDTTTGNNAFLESDITVTNGTLQAGSLNRDNSVIATATVAATYTATVTLPEDADRKNPLTVTVAANSFQAASLGNIEGSLEIRVEVPPTNGTPDTPVATPTGTGGDLTNQDGFEFKVDVRANEFIVLAKSPGNAGFTSAAGDFDITYADGRTPATWNTKDTLDDATRIDIADNLWVDLRHFFVGREGGSIDLIGPTSGANNAKVRELVISEVMWGNDNGLSTPADSQWIELYNTTGASISGTWKLVFNNKSKGAAMLANDTATTDASPVVDKLSTWRNVGSTWAWRIEDKADGNHGQSGKSTLNSATSPGSPMEIVSMQRKIDYVGKVEKAGNDRAAQLKDFPNGAASGGWEATKEHGNMDPYRKGTPGAEPVVVTFAQTGVPRGSVIFNEIANRSTKTHDWIELYNKSSSDKTINNWELSVVSVDSDGKRDDRELFYFQPGDNGDDIVVPAKGYLLIVNTPPSHRNNRLEGGYDTQEPGNSKREGAASLRPYYVTNKLDIPEKDFLLILRNGNDKTGTHEKIEDIAGNNPSFPDGNINTEVWPLRTWTLGAKDDLGQNDTKTWVRDQGKAVFHGDAWKSDGGFTGVGIDRQYDSSDGLASGTPGYANNAVQNEVKSDGLTEATPVVISEIMFAIDPNGRVPQWIELHNPSHTQAVNLNKWRLEIVNYHGDTSLRVNDYATLVLPERRIQPNQTVLIVSRETSKVSSSANFPENRIIGIWNDTELKKAMGMDNSRDAVLSSMGFHLKLSDPKKKVVDEVGNIDANQHNADEPAWTLPGGFNDDGNRSSMVRAEDTENDGEEGDSWRDADAVSSSKINPDANDLFYGDADDIGTPGYTPGGVLPVQLSSFYSKRNDAGAVIITWSTESELDNAGFNILRSLSRVGEFTRINAQLIPGAGTTGEKNTYTWTDTSARPNVVYYYQIEDVSLDGEHRTLRTTRLRGYVGAAGKATTIWGELKSRD